MAPPAALARIVPPSSTSPPNAQPRPRLLTPTTNPIPLLSAPTAQLYTLLHTALIPSLYLVRSSALVADPLRTLTYDLLPVATAQMAFCVLCLPSSGTWNSGTVDGGKILEGSATHAGRVSGGSAKSPMQAGKGGIGRRKGRGGVTAGAGAVRGLDDPTVGGFGARIMPAIFSLVLTLLLAPIPLQVLLHALGAPLLPISILADTLALATHLSLLIFLPLFYTHGVSSSAWRDIAAAWLPFDRAGVWGAAVGTAVGAWLGAVPIALDWDREWQKWPVTVVWGAVGGWVLGRGLTLRTGQNQGSGSGSGLGLGLGYGKRIDLSEIEEVPVDVDVDVESTREAVEVEDKKDR